MPIVMNMKWAGVTPEQYENVRKASNYEVDVPKGAIYHVAAFDKEGMRVTDVWETADDFNNFVKTRLMPAVQQVGMKGEPKVEILPATAIFAPGYKK